MVQSVRAAGLGAPSGIGGHFPQCETSLCAAIGFWLPTGVDGIRQ